MGRRTAAVTDYQQRAREFQVGDLVYPFLSGNRDLMGRVVGVYPAIGMVQVQWPHGSERMPVEDLQRFESDEYKPPEVENDTVPGGRHTVPVSSGTGRTASVNRVAEIVAEIAAASQEQSVGIEQVNKAITQMDQVTQSYAAQTEELSSTAQQLSSQAGAMTAQACPIAVS